MNREIVVVRGGNSLFAMKADNGDLFDSKLYMYNGLSCQEELSFVNTDFTAGYKGGILAEGTYDYIIGMHKGKYKSAFFCKDLKFWQNWDQLTLEQITLPSLISNPNHNGKKIIIAVRLHRSAGDWDNSGKPDNDGSHGCFTVWHKDYWKFEDCYELNDRGRIRVERSTSWIVPEFYK